MNEDWWQLDADESLRSEGMYIEHIRVNIFNKVEHAMGVFQSGDVDVAGISVNEYLKYMGRTDITIRNYTSRDFEFISMNLEDPVLSDIYARRAIALSIDRKSIISELLRGAAEEADLPVLPSCWLEDAREACPGQETGAGGQAQESSENGVPEDAEDVAGNNGEGDAQPVSGDAADLYSARTPEEVLTLGGWKQSQQGYYKVIKGSRRHLELEMLVNSNNSLRVRAAEMICGQLEQAGIKSNWCSFHGTTWSAESIQEIQNGVPGVQGASDT